MLVDTNTCFGKMPTRRVRYAEAVTSARMFDEPGPAVPTTQDVDWSLDNLLRIMEYHQVDRALTYSLRGKLYDFAAGNEETWRAARSHRQLEPVATVDPRRHFGCIEEVKRCADWGFRIFRLFPDEQGWVIDSLPFLRICEALSEHGMAVMLPAGPWGWQSLIGELICPFGVPVVTMGATFTTVAESMAVACEHSNFFCDTSAMHMADCIEGFVGLAGADRLMFGSNSPESYFESARGLVDAARLSDSHRAAVLSHNALRHLGLQEGP